MIFFIGNPRFLVCRLRHITCSVSQHACLQFSGELAHTYCSISTQDAGFSASAAASNDLARAKTDILPFNPDILAELRSLTGWIFELRAAINREASQATVTPLRKIGLIARQPMAPLGCVKLGIVCQHIKEGTYYPSELHWRIWNLQIYGFRHPGTPNISKYRASAINKSLEPLFGVPESPVGVTLLTRISTDDVSSNSFYGQSARAIVRGAPP